MADDKIRDVQTKCPSLIEQTNDKSNTKTQCIQSMINNNSSNVNLGDSKKTIEQISTDNQHVIQSNPPNEDDDDHHKQRTLSSSSSENETSDIPYEILCNDDDDDDDQPQQEFP